MIPAWRLYYTLPRQTASASLVKVAVILSSRGSIRGSLFYRKSPRRRDGFGGVGTGAPSGTGCLMNQRWDDSKAKKQQLSPPRPHSQQQQRQSRQAANEAVEAALSSADADREEACAELAASMTAEVRPTLAFPAVCLDFRYHHPRSGTSISISRREQSPSVGGLTLPRFSEKSTSLLFRLRLFPNEASVLDTNSLKILDRSSVGAANYARNLRRCFMLCTML